MFNYKPISVDRARVQYFQSMHQFNAASTGIERDIARDNHRQATRTLKHAQRTDRNHKAEYKRAKERRRVDWNVAVF